MGWGYQLLDCPLPNWTSLLNAVLPQEKTPPAANSTAKIQTPTA